MSDSGTRRSPAKIIVTILVLVLLAGGGITFWIMKQKSNARMRDTAALIRLKMVWPAMQNYAAEHDGRFPSDLSAFGLERKYIVLPENTLEAPVCSIVAYAVEPNTDGNIITLFFHGTVEALPPEEVKTRIAEDLAKFEAYPGGPLHQAVWTRDAKKLKQLLETAPDVNETNEKTWTPLHLAAALGEMDAAEALVAKGAKLEAPNQAGMTPLHVAVRFGQMNIVKFLITKGADLAIRTSFGDTVLHEAVALPLPLELKYLKIDGAPGSAWRKEKIAILKFLIDDNKVDINAKNEIGITALVSAAGTDQLEAVQVLLDSGADGIEDALNNAQIMMQFTKKSDMVDLIQSYMKKNE